MPAEQYRAKARECATRAQSMNDPERRADMLEELAQDPRAFRPK